jgi:membrane-associated phospholipid phosphatase/protein-S-isoprenylcysteine O-methyltransferase Ste14
MANHSVRTGKFFYGFLFVVAIPVLLIGWARLTEDSVKILPLNSVLFGAAVVLLGTVIMLSGMAALIFYGKGLPMNAYPPTEYVTQGIYRLMPHPIYVGFSIICIGASIATGSASGLWIVSPVVILGCVAIVQGYERQDLLDRFSSVSAKPLLHIPANESVSPSFSDRLSIYVLVFVPWFILYEAVQFIGTPADAFSVYFPFERELPVLEWTELFYGSVYFFILLAPLIAKTKKDLREFSTAVLISTGMITLLFLAIPFIAQPRPFFEHNFFGRLLLLERAYDSPTTSFPSFHVVWAFLGARLYARSIPSLKMFWWSWAVLISISCITTGMHAMIDVLAGFLFFLFVAHLETVWEWLRSMTEQIANSWKEWRFGPVRIINHGFYAGLGAFLGLAIIGTLTGVQYILSAVVVAFCTVIGAALWAQFVEGSPSLLRPYGWYGGVLGAFIGAVFSKFMGTDPWLLLAAFSVGSPFTQSAGRLRCLVQGCCHGRESSPAVGIRYTHPRTRVCRLSNLKGVPIHPTPLYSILWNIVIAIVMLRLWFLHSPLCLIAGMYLILTGLGRFVEEPYRGEPQTPIYAGLRLYQWLAVLSVVGGILATIFGNKQDAPLPQVNSEAIVSALIFAVICTFAYGVDFPNSNVRFSRLA